MSTRLKFFEKTHKYTLRGLPIPGVTTLIGGGVPKPGLPYWAAKTVAEYVVGHRDEVVSLIDSSPAWEAIKTLKGIPWETRDAAGIKGSEIHTIAEEIIHGREVEVPERHRPYVEGYIKFLETFDVQPIVTEVPVANETWWYAGRLDAIVTMGRGPWAGEVSLIDWKTSKSVYGDTALQCAGYINAEFYVDREGKEQPLPVISRMGVVHITENGSYLYDLGPIDKAFAEFKSCAYIAKTADRRKDLIGQPLSLEEVPA